MFISSRTGSSKQRERLRKCALLSRADFDAILADVCARRYAKPELAMSVLACALRRLDTGELIAFTESMIACGSRLSFEADVVADKHCIGGIPGNRTTMIVVLILATLGLIVPKTSSRAITSPSGTADTMATLAEVALSPERIRQVVERTGACIAWGGALDLAPADDVLITVERPMGIDTEGQMIASILSKKKTAGATHALIDSPVGRPRRCARSRSGSRWPSASAALLVPLLAGLLGFINSFRMVKLPDLEPSSAAEGMVLG